MIKERERESMPLDLFKNLIRVGVPIHFRSLLWQCLAKVDTSRAKDAYADLMKMTSPCEKVIRRDITRTFPEHPLFKEEHGAGQESLFNVIKVRRLISVNEDLRSFHF
jgi:ecotropic viral integration site 5 protein